MLTQTVAARGCMPPGANVFIAASTLQSDLQLLFLWSYGYDDGISVDCEQYAKLGV